MAGYRTVLEVLKWSDHSDLCAQLNQVNSLWFKSASSDEVWDVLCEANGFPSMHGEYTSKVAFLRQFHSLTVFVLHRNRLREYNLLKKQWKSVVLEKTGFSCASSLVLYLPYVVATGTEGPCTGQSALIHINTGEITPLPSMSTARCQHGSLLYQSTVYVFAGSNETDLVTDSTEKLSLQPPTQWTALPPLLSRLAFSSPCRKDTFAYICGGWGTNMCQRFDLNLEVYSLLLFVTPMDGVLTTAFVYNEEIYFCQSGHLGRWSGADTAPLVISTFPEVTGSNW
jgi:hypothetical protein